LFRHSHEQIYPKYICWQQTLLSHGGIEGFGTFLDEEAELIATSDGKVEIRIGTKSSGQASRRPTRFRDRDGRNIPPSG
jgi:hypothetical protein